MRRLTSVNLHRPIVVNELLTQNMFASMISESKFRVVHDSIEKE